MSKNTHPHTTSALAARRAELLADTRRLRERIRQNEGYIKALDTTIGLMNPAFDPSALAARRAELLADTRRLRERIRQNENYIKALDTSIGLMNPTFDPGTVLPKRRYIKKFERGELKSLIIRTLKEADGGPLSTEDITAQVMAHKGLARDCRAEVRAALTAYDFVERTAREDDHRDYWILRCYAAKGEASEGGMPVLRLLRDQ